jgi:hypothetical protein
LIEEPTEIAVAVSVPVVLLPAKTVAAVVLPKLNEKSGINVVRVKVAVCVAEPAVPVTLMVKLPAEVFPVVVIVRVAAAGVVRVGETGFGVMVQVVFAGQPEIV